MKGDGIGPEVVDSMLKVLNECNIQSEIILCEAGSEQWEKNGRKDKSYIPDDTIKILEESDACFKGPTTTIPIPGAPRSVAVTLRQIRVQPQPSQSQELQEVLQLHYVKNLNYIPISDQLKLMTD